MQCFRLHPKHGAGAAWGAQGWELQLPLQFRREKSKRLWNKKAPGVGYISTELPWEPQVPSSTVFRKESHLGTWHCQISSCLLNNKVWA